MIQVAEIQTKRDAKTTPERMCICCRQRRDKPALLRMVINDNSLVFDRKQKKGGRGYYICPDLTCIEKCLNGKKIKKVVNNKDLEDLVALKEIMKREVGIKWQK
ncbi:MAG: YlxR family protein [Nitrospirae bacterium]|uniref:YlxR family protein n=1 Tax=Candidatus Magnetobacterium casense TaxID=1455061 RepID=UPI000696EDE5|nr:YlxR family protein [Candidatus Magnetobacterium casensis]MBF0337831.1 YlxR family protein [Nitrospirota bacterium]